MNYEGILEFHGTWRSYQARVLQNVSRYLSDDKIHIVAAPGSGKTTLGIELIKRLNANTLILAPSITIREQWAARIQEAFLCDGYSLEDYVSLSLKQPKAITVATYQALHSAMTRFCGTETPGEDTAPTDSEEVDYSDFDLVRTMKNANIELLCLDECHHLRSEWWKSLEAFQSQLSSLRTISLTATPPYDSTPAMWTRYMNMCGDIDEEITIPELVKEGSLCPHQDYVYFNYPTTAETKEIQNFEERSSQMLQSLMQDSQLLTVIETHKGLNGQISDDLLLDDPEYLEAILIYLQSKNAAFPARLQRLLGTKKLPAMDVEWMERLLQGFLYDDSDSYLCDKVYREMLIDQLKSQGLIEKKKVKCLVGYSSALGELSEYIRKTGRDCSRFRVRAIIPISETMPEPVRRTLSEQFGCPVRAWYSNEENGIMGLQNEDNEGYHIDTETYYYEILKMDSDEPAEPGELGRIVITDLFNYAFPIIRYDNGDTAVAVRKEKNGRFKLCLSVLYGRRSDLIYDCDGKAVTPYIITNNLWDIQGVKQYRFIQEDVQDYTIWLNGDPEKMDQEEILRRIRPYLGEEARIKIEMVDEIPVLASGKRKYIENRCQKYQQHKGFCG